MSDTNMIQDRLKDVIYKLNKKDHFCIFREAVNAKDVLRMHSYIFRYQIIMKLSNIQWI